MHDPQAKTAGVIGLGDMGLHLAANLVKNGFATSGFDLREERMGMLEDAGGKPAASVADLAGSCDAIFLMVLNGKQVHAIAGGPEGLLANMRPGQAAIVTATISPHELEQLLPEVDAAGVDLIDSPVSGGMPGAASGTLTLMVAGADDAIERHKPALEAVSAKILRVGDKPGQGQRVKAALQAGFGAVFASLLEAAALAAKLGVPPETVKEVFMNTLIGGKSMEACLSNALERKFAGTGSTVNTIHKDLGISLAMGRETGLPMAMSSASYQLFEATLAMFPGEDNWALYKVLEAVSSKYPEEEGKQ